MDLVFNLNVLIIIYTVQAYSEPVGYIGCFDDGGGQQLPIRLKSSDTNSGDECKQRCKGYRYAGTKAANQCHCGTTLMNTRTGTKCTLKCTGNQNEICGGVSYISIYDNWNCVKQPCGNNAIKCTDKSASDYVCTCREGWTGRHCSEEISSTSPPIFTTSTTTITRDIFTRVKTTLKSSTSAGIITSTSTTRFVSNETTFNLTTMSIKEVTDPDKEDSMYMIYILSAAVFMFCVIVAVVAFFVGRQRGRRTTNSRQDVRDVSEIHEYNDLVDIVRGYSNPYSGTADNQYTASNSNDNTSYLTPCTSTRPDSSNEYAYID